MPKTTAQYFAACSCQETPGGSKGERARQFRRSDRPGNGWAAPAPTFLL